MNTDNNTVLPLGAMITIATQGVRLQLDKSNAKQCFVHVKFT